MASDIVTSFQDLHFNPADSGRTSEPTNFGTTPSSSSGLMANLAHGVQDPVAAAISAPTTYQSFSSQSLLDKSPESLEPSQAQAIDRVAELSKQTFDPTTYLLQFKQRVPSKSQAQAGLIGASVVPQTTNSNSRGVVSTAISTEKPQATQFVDGSALASLFRNLPTSSSDTNAQIASVNSSRSIQWVGGFCREDGSANFVNASPIENNYGLVAEGEGDDPLVPTFEIPALASSQYASNLSLFAPPSQSTGSTITTLGNFTPSSLANPDYSLPGLNWALQKDQTWTSSEQWSYSETLVLSFNFENNDTDQWGSTITDGEDGSSGSGESSSGASGSGDSNGGSGNHENPLKGLDGQANGLVTASATRKGFFSFSFSASRGVSTPTSAGIAWSYSVTYSDSVSIGASASGSAHYTPTVGTQGNGNQGDSGSSVSQYGANTNDGVVTNDYPTDFSAESSWGASISLSVYSMGTIVLSSIPLLNSDGEVERANNALLIYSAGGEAEAEEHWSSSSQSGNLVLVDHPAGAGENPLDGIQNNNINLIGGFSSSGQLTDVNSGANAQPAVEPSPVGGLSGSGHASMSSGSRQEKAKGDTNGSFVLQSRSKLAELLALNGLSSTLVDGNSEVHGDGSHTFVFRDEKIKQIPGGYTVNTVELIAGWGGDGEVDGDSDGDSTIDLSLSSDGRPIAPNDDVSGEVNGNTNQDGGQFIRLRIVDQYHHAYSSSGVEIDGPYSSNGSTDRTSEIIYTSRDNGTSLGDVYGFAEPDLTDANYNSKLDGLGYAQMVKKYNEDWNGTKKRQSDGRILSTGNGKVDMIEMVHSSYVVGGTAFGQRDEEGVVWSIDAKIVEKQKVIYNDKERTYELYDPIDCILSCSMLYDWTRTASFDAPSEKSSSILGGGFISAYNPLDDIGFVTVTNSSTPPRTIEVIVNTTGTHDGRPAEKTLHERELESLYGNGLPVGGDDGAGSDESGSSGSGSGTALSGNGSVVLSATGGFFMGLAQGACNLVNGVQDAAVGVANLAIAVPNTVAGTVDYAFGVTDPHYQIRVPYITSPDWSRNLVTEEGGTPGGWDDSHGWSKFAGGEGAMALITGGASKAASAVDDAGKCANWFAKFVNGGCFVAGTFVTVCEMPYSEARETALWSETDWLDDTLDFGHSEEQQESPISTLKSKRLLIPIEQVPIGARVPTKNPRPWEYDDSLPDPVQSEWGLIAMTMVRDDGGIVDAELIRPWSWIRSHRIEAGKPLPMNIPELQVTGVAMVTSVGECPEIAEGEGSVITARFLTRQVDIIARAEILGADGTIEVLEGTTIHPIWSLDRNEWVPLGELEFGEQLVGQSGPATVLNLTIANRPTAVYNIEVHGEHVYQIGVLACLVHNECVYQALDQAGNVIYVGITKDLLKRAAQHASRFNITPIIQNLTRSDARAIEQRLIETIGLSKNGGTLLNKINSIAQNNPIYQSSILRAITLGF